MFPPTPRRVRDKLKELATTIQTREERILKSLLHRLGPWLIWFYPDPGACAKNWRLCRAFVRAYNSLPDSIRNGFSPYLFTIVTLDPTKAAPPPPAPATTTPVTATTPPETTAPLPQYPHDEQPL